MCNGQTLEDKSPEFHTTSVSSPLDGHLSLCPYAKFSRALKVREITQEYKCVSHSGQTFY